MYAWAVDVMVEFLDWLSLPEEEEDEDAEGSWDHEPL